MPAARNCRRAGSESYFLIRQLIDWIAIGFVGMTRFLSTAAVGVLSAGTLGVGLLAAGPAHATCASAFGFGNSTACSSSPTTIAIAIGTGAEAHAEGALGTAFALGNGAFAGFYGSLGTATALGDSSSAVAANLGVAFSAGSHAVTHAGAAPTEVFNLAVSLGSSDAEATGLGDVSVNLFGSGSQVLSFGTGSVAFNTGDQSQVTAWGTLVSATNLGGYQIHVDTASGSSASSAFNVLGSGNWVEAHTGPFAIAGSVFQSGAMISQGGPGIHINGLKAGSAAATQPAATTTAAKHTATKGLGGSKKKHG